MALSATTLKLLARHAADKFDSLLPILFRLPNADINVGYTLYSWAFVNQDLVIELRRESDIQRVSFSSDVVAAALQKLDPQITLNV